jgi:hypothetical protein
MVTVTCPLYHRYSHLNLFITWSIWQQILHLCHQLCNWMAYWNTLILQWHCQVTLFATQKPCSSTSLYMPAVLDCNFCQSNLLMLHKTDIPFCLWIWTDNIHIKLAQFPFSAVYTIRYLLHETLYFLAASQTFVILHVHYNYHNLEVQIITVQPNSFLTHCSLLQ